MKKTTEFSILCLSENTEMTLLSKDLKKSEKCSILRLLTKGDNPLI